MSDLKIMSIDEIAKKAEPEVVAIPGWNDDFINVRLKRPSMLSMASKGQIPNSLLSAAQKVFTSTIDSTVTMKDLNEVVDAVVKAALYEPTWEAFEEAGIELTDDQKVAIFSYTQKGIDGLYPFYPKSTDSEDNNTGETSE